MTITELHLFRHGETLWNEQGLMQGHLDSGLSANGMKQARNKASQLGGIAFDVVVTSTSDRASETARILLGDRSTAVIKLDDLREINLGAWEGQAKSEVSRQYADDYHKFWHDPPGYLSVGGETFAALWQRTTSVVERLLVEHAGTRILVVSHAAAVKAIMSYFSGRTLGQIWDPPFAENLSHSILVADETGVRVARFCDTPWAAD